MKIIKSFEVFESLSIDKKIDMFVTDAKQKSEVYSVPKNQMKIDLFYDLKTAIRHYIDDSKRGFIDRTQAEYEKRLNNEIDGILYKFSKSKYNNILEDDVDEVKDILWEEINKIIPYNEVDYFHTYDLQGKLSKLLDNFILKITEIEYLFQ
jgi:hypothetical protein